MAENDEIFMQEALSEAHKALLEGEVPVGAVVVVNGIVAGRGHNTVEKEKNAIRHAEINAIEDACRSIGCSRLKGGQLYVTLEPCPMCAGAILNCRIQRVVYGASDKDGGAFGGIIDLSKLQPLKGPYLRAGILEEECRRLLENFFKKLRMSDN